MNKKFYYSLLLTVASFIILPSNPVAAATDNSTSSGISVDSQSINTIGEEYDFAPSAVNNKIGKNVNYLDKKSDTILVDDTGLVSLMNVPEDYSVTFKSSNESKLSIEQMSDTSCAYTGKAAGSAYITIKVKSPGLFFMASTTTIKYKVTISPRAVSIKFKQAQYTVSEGKSKKVKLTIRPSITKEQPTYDVSNPSIASIDDNGKVSGKKEGSTYITASISNGTNSQCKIIVKAK